MDFVEIDEFFSASGTFLTEDGDISCDATTTTVVAGYDTEGSTPEYQFSPESLQYGSPESYISDDVNVVPVLMHVESAPQYASTEPEAPKMHDTSDDGTPCSFNPFEEPPAAGGGIPFEEDAMLVGATTTNPLYDSNEALHLVGQSKTVVGRPALAQSAPAPVGPSSKKKRKANKAAVIKQEEGVASAGMVTSPIPPTPRMADGGPPRLTFTARSGVAKMCNAESEIGIVDFQTDADKGFNYSPIDNAFVCQKKNHFQVSAAVQLSGIPTFVLVQDATGHAEYTPIESLQLAVWGLKDENPPSSVDIEQSHVDRSKKPFAPEPIQLDAKAAYRTTFNRLHFCETTANNMRKKGKPNPEQRHFKLLVELHAMTTAGNLVSIYCQESDSIIVRASNPGQFDGESENMKWQKGKVLDSIVHHGPVGINTDRPFSALTVNGNVAVTGTIMHPSDLRIKEQLEPMDNKKQLENIQAMRLYEYQVRQPWAEAAGRDTEDRREVGVIAQNMQRVLPDAVKETGENIELNDGSRIDNLLIVDKDRIFMENVGAVQELCRMSENMDLRIRELEILKDSVVAGKYGEGIPLEGDFSYGERPKRRLRRKKGSKGHAAEAEGTRGEWETLTHPGWTQIPVKNSKETFPVERLVCYVVGVLTVFALLIVIVILITQQDDHGDNGNATSTIASLTAAATPNPTDPLVISPLSTLTSSPLSTLVSTLTTHASSITTTSPF